MTIWLPDAFQPNSATFLSALSSGKRSGGGDSIRSISPAISALTAVLGSGMASHSTRSTLATLPPASIEGGSLRGLYFGFFTNTTFSPGFHSSFLKMKGPEPV